MEDIVIESENDLLKLESAIRQNLQCEGATCAFLESVPYVQIRIGILRRIHGGSPDANTHTVRIFPHPSFMITVTDFRIASLSSRTPPLEPVVGGVGRPR
jgi:hypothetical protein